jgi:hypothetical protein
MTTTAPVAPATFIDAGPPDPRRCGRCRATFAGDRTLAQGIDPGWWACEPCRATLFGPIR